MVISSTRSVTDGVDQIQMKKIREAWLNRTLERGSENAEVGRCYLRYSEFGHCDGSLFRPRRCPVTDSIPTELLANKLFVFWNRGRTFLAGGC